MPSKYLVSTVGGLAGAAVVFGLGTHFLAGTESTTALDTHSTASVGGHKALAAYVVEGRTESKYNPLPWVGVQVSDVTCPTGLKAVAGASVTCTGKKRDGGSVDIPVSVVKASDTSVTWKFDR
ncbi:DUF4333 domain-containing protein [Streptomyces sp. SID13726]|uniref:DUF4333 domain-containing protein n=1 Tax=Streptomyces sp. SID13726 TaxID=2706058 RepID=UPI0013B8FDFB|nr:DUF4333 domain-containing protein [Streptomyces sp. SID13726]NEA99292.1 DUF4333 domain-containing protein [Streptomyces sp. SID13726]